MRRFNLRTIFGHPIQSFQPHASRVITKTTRKRERTARVKSDDDCFEGESEGHERTSIPETCEIYGFDVDYVYIFSAAYSRGAILNPTGATTAAAAAVLTKKKERAMPEFCSSRR